MRPKYYDLTPGDFGAQLEPYEFVELKFDGLYAELVADESGWSIHGRNERVIRYGNDPCDPCYLRGEMIIDTEWARASPLFGYFQAWDVIYCSNGEGSMYIPHQAMEDISDCLREAVVGLQGIGWDGFDLIDFSIWQPKADAAKLWAEEVQAGGWEGLVFRSADGQRWGRMKRVVTRDYVCSGFRTSGNCVTALHGALYRRGRLETVVTVPVKAAAAQRSLWRNREALAGRVFEAAGNAVTRSGSLRHPRHAGEAGAVLWRPDKREKECRG